MEFTKIVDFPDGVDIHTAKIFVAWCIASRSFEKWVGVNSDKSPDEFLAAYLELFKKAYNGILN